MRFLLAFMSLGSIGLGLFLVVAIGGELNKPGGGLIVAIQLAQGVSLIAAGIGFAWMAAVLQELQGIRKDLRQVLSPKPTPAPAREEPRLASKRLSAS